jgi:hypothetical protein
MQVRTDFLWQRSPFLLFGGGEGLIEGPGIDYILPYWMARYYGVLTEGPQAPSVSVLPSSGSGSSATLQFRFSDPYGFQSLSVALAVVNPVLSAANSCYIFVDTRSRWIYLANDAATNWLGPVAPGTAATLQNSQCAISVGAASSLGAGDTLGFSLPLSFPAGAGMKNVYMYAEDASGLNTGWQQRGAWTVP